MSNTAHWYTNASDWKLRFSLLFCTTEIYRIEIVVEIVIHHTNSNNIRLKNVVVENWSAHNGAGKSGTRCKCEIFNHAGKCAQTSDSASFFVCVILYECSYCLPFHWFVLGNKRGFGTNLRRATGRIFVQKRSVSTKFSAWIFVGSGYIS